MTRVSTRAVAISVSEPAPVASVARRREPALGRLHGLGAARPARQAVGARQAAERVEQQRPRPRRAPRHAWPRSSARSASATCSRGELLASRLRRPPRDRPTPGPPPDGRRRARRARCTPSPARPVPISRSSAVAPLPGGPAISARWPRPSGATSCTMRAASASPSSSGRLGRCTGRSSNDGALPSRGPLEILERPSSASARSRRAGRRPRRGRSRRLGAARPLRPRGRGRGRGSGPAVRQRRGAGATSSPLSAATSCSRRSRR